MQISTKAVMATVIKGGLTEHDDAFCFAELRPPRHNVLEQARADAAEILATAHAEAILIRADAERLGSEAGRDEAKRQLATQAAAVVDAVRPVVQHLASELAQQRQAWLAQWEQQAVRLAAAIAGRVVRRELTRQPDIPVALVAEALELVAGKPDLRILLNPEDRRACGAQIALLAADLAGVAETAVQEDPSIARGGCRIETRHGTIDQTLEAQLERIERELT
jgi:flagellar assembly protein FliH